MKYHIFVLVFFILLSSQACKNPSQPSQKHTVERIEIYGAKGENNSYEKDSIMYVEINYFDGERKIKTEYLNADGTLRGKEIMQYNSTDKQLTGAEYFDVNDTLLSYYKYVLDNDHLKVSSVAFDAKNNEILRSEKYEYDANKHLSKKNIYDGNNDLNRSFIFTNDANGNATEMTILNPSLQPIAIESYKIIKFDNKNQWLEKWGFIKDLPKTYYKRTFE